MQTLDSAFLYLIAQRGVYQDIGVSESHVKQVRYKLRHGTGRVSDEFKRKWLMSAGYKPAHAEMWYTPGESIRIEHSPPLYNIAQMIDFAKFFHRQGSAARKEEMYCFEKWEKSGK